MREVGYFVSQVHPGAVKDGDDAEDDMEPSAQEGEAGHQFLDDEYLVQDAQEIKGNQQSEIIFFLAAQSF